MGETAGVKQDSGDLRARARRQLEAGRPVGEGADRFGGHRTTLRRWRRRQAAGDLAPRARPGRTPKLGRAERPRLLGPVAAAPEATLAEHCAAWATAWATATGVAVRPATMGRALRRRDWPLNTRP